MSDLPLPTDWMDPDPWPGPDMHPFDSIVRVLLVTEFQGFRTVHRHTVPVGSVFKWRAPYEIHLIGLFLEDDYGRASKLYPKGPPDTVRIMREGDILAWNF